MKVTNKILVSFALLVMAPAPVFADAGKTSHIYTCDYYDQLYRVYVRAIHTSEAGDTKVSLKIEVDSLRDQGRCEKMAADLNGK